MQAFDEGRKKVNNLPLAVQCLLMNGNEPQKRWPRLHYHDYIELLYPVKGDYEVNLNGTVYPLPEGSMFIINAGEQHTTFAKSSDRSLFCVKFLPQVLYSSEQTVTEMEQTIPFVFENFGSKRCFLKEELADTGIPEVFKEIIKENTEQRFGYELAIRSDVLKIFAWVIRFWHENGTGEQAEKTKGLELISKVKEYIHQNLSDVTLYDVAKMCGLSYSYLSRTFKRVAQMSFSDYVNFARVNASMKLLATTDRNITDVALTCGFSSTSYYIYTFKKLKNISPNGFRKMMKQTKNRR